MKLKQGQMRENRTAQTLAAQRVTPKNEERKMRNESKKSVQTVAIQEVVRVGEKNNFNQTAAEYDALKGYEKPGRAFFVNSNALTPIKSTLPAFVTLAPYLSTFEPPRGDLSTVKAYRIKLIRTARPEVEKALNQALDFAAAAGVPALITFMRFRSKKTAADFIGCAPDTAAIKAAGYVFNAGYYRPTPATQKALEDWARGRGGRVEICDKKGKGCPSCGLCAALSYGLKKSVPVESLNLSISGVEDSNGRRGLCPFNCPDCWAKIVTYGKAPACDRITQNRKQKGQTSHI
jgi:hypothetical protein